MDEATGNESVETSSPQEIESQSDSLANDLASDLYPERERPEHERTESEDHEYDNVKVKADEAEPESEETEVKEEVVAKEAPKSWNKEMQAKYSTLPPEIQDYVVLREQQMMEGLEKDRSDSNLGRVMRDTMAPYRALLNASGVNETQAVQSLMNVHYKLTNLPMEEKANFLASMAKSYGIDLPGYEQQEETPIDPTVKRLQDELNGIKQSLTRNQEVAITQAKQRVTQEVEVFATEHPYFDEVADDIAAMIQAGHDLENAYEKAVWANPVTRQKELARLQQEQTVSIREKAKKEADIARKAAGLNVKAKETSRTPTGPKHSMRNLDSALEESMREHKSRTH